MSKSELSRVRGEHANGEVHPAVRALARALQERFGTGLCAVLYYGSCLRGGDPFDGLVDLYLVVDRYRYPGQGRLAAFFNWLLPPNVYYLESELDGRVVRAKYAVVSQSDFLRGTSRRWFHSYLWARFAQPVGIVYVRDQAVAGDINRALGEAVVTMIERTLPLIPSRFDWTGLWQEGLTRTYRAELRVEKAERTRQLIQADRPYFEAVTDLALAQVRHPVTPLEDGYSSRIGQAGRLGHRVLWGLRTGQGKALSVLRLVKGTFTFDGGLDYLVWKLERHAGERIEVPERVRRYPLVFVWGLFWRLYRRGVFR